MYTNEKKRQRAKLKIIDSQLLWRQNCFFMGTFCSASLPTFKMRALISRKTGRMEFDPSLLFRYVSVFPSISWYLFQFTKY